jgi:hypothetical protein
MDGNDKLLVVKGLSGLGNRIFSALNGILYSRASGRRLIFDWRDPQYSTDGTDIFHRLFECSSACPADGRFLDADSIAPAIWRGHLKEPADHLAARYGFRFGAEKRANLSIDVSRMDYPETLVVLLSHGELVNALRPHFTGALEELAHQSNSEILADMLKKDLILRPEIRAKVDEFKRANFKPEQTVGIHVRYSDYRTDVIGSLSQLNALLQQKPELTVFLASDNIEITRIFARSYSNVVTTPHWYPRPGLRIHGNRHCPDLIESAVDALVDIYLLAECDYLIFDNSSSFARIAKLLSKAPPCNMIRVGNLRKGSWGA